MDILGDRDVPKEGELHVQIVHNRGLPEEGVRPWQWAVSLRKVQPRDPELQVAPHTLGGLSPRVFSLFEA